MKSFDVYPLMDVNMLKAFGTKVWDADGREYLDFYGGHAVISIGHCHPYFVEKIQKQTAALPFYSNAVQNELREELAEKLGTLSGYEDYALFMVNSGAEAIENALKLASFQNQRTKIIAFERSFHGRTAAAVNITDNPAIIAPLNKGFEKVFVSWNDYDMLEQQVSQGDVCAVVIEGIQGVGGIYVPDAAFLQKAAQLCRKYGTVLILDEIQSGYGRSGLFFAHQYAAIKPDLITIAKGMGNGFPVGGVLIAPHFEARHGLLGTTFGGTHLACAAALAVVDVLKQENLIDNAAQRGQQLIAALSDIDAVVQVRGNGCMIGVELSGNAAPVRSKLLNEYGVLTGSSSHKNTVRLLPPLSVSETEVFDFIARLKDCLNKYS